jgi:hypothetical protein
MLPGVEHILGVACSNLFSMRRLDKADRQADKD